LPFLFVADESPRADPLPFYPVAGGASVAKKGKVVQAIEIFYRSPIYMS
jgi:hypothetical protein